MLTPMAINSFSRMVRTPSFCAAFMNPKRALIESGISSSSVPTPFWKLSSRPFASNMKAVLPFFGLPARRTRFRLSGNKNYPSLFLCQIFCVQGSTEGAHHVRLIGYDNRLPQLFFEQSYD